MNNLIPHPTNANVLYAVLPNDAMEIEVKETSKVKPKQLYHKVNYVGLMTTNQRLDVLPLGNWRILCLTTELSEGVALANGLVEIGHGWSTYYKHSLSRYSSFDTDLKAHQSLIKSLGLVDRNEYDEEMKGMTFFEGSNNKWQQAQQQVNKIAILIREE